MCHVASSSRGIPVLPKLREVQVQALLDECPKDGGILVSYWISFQVLFLSQSGRSELQAKHIAIKIRVHQWSAGSRHRVHEIF